MHIHFPLVPLTELSSFPPSPPQKTLISLILNKYFTFFLTNHETFYAGNMKFISFFSVDKGKDVLFLFVIREIQIKPQGDTTDYSLECLKLKKEDYINFVGM